MVPRTLAFTFLTLLSFVSLADAQTWTPLIHQPPFQAGTALLLTDGTVMTQQMSGGFGTGQWWKLTPDNTGSYINGTWSQLATMPSSHAPLYYASAVLPDGRVVIAGGEYNGTAQSETNLSAIYSPATNSWTSIAPPSGIAQIGDASSVILPSGTFMLGPCCFQTTEWLLNPLTLTWTATGSNKADSNVEESWTLLPNGAVLTVDTANGTNSEVYNASTGSWSSAGSTIVPLSTGSPALEIGPAVLRPDGTVFATGGTSNTAIYNTASGNWAAGPAFPSGFDIADGPAALLPNGNVLADTAPGVFGQGTRFFEFDGSSLIAVSGPPSAASDYSYIGRMLVLPTGQILFTNQTSSVQIYSTSGTFQGAWQPVITSAPGTLSVGSNNNTISGTQFNGFSQGAMYGDDAQAATNYPLVRITNNATGHVTYARTHNHSTMAVATGSAIVSTQFDVPSNTESGSCTLQVVANGIPSNGVTVQVTGSNGNPFTYLMPRDQQLACYGISVAPNFPSNCRDITDFNDKQMCSGMSQLSQTPCQSMTDRNLQLACYGMSVAPNFPSNCRDITDPQMQNFCYGVSSGGSMPNCNSATDGNTRALCFAMSVHNASSCSNITNSNDRLFCQGVAGRSQTPCTSIQ
ncbi:MAG TPA: kelch repeat-containing protein [Candidatus Angelobacter sp.]|jgi:hypothetical protein|nr:kelch repeat-containing protein [Candidatus Angelobacter sp.]